MGGSAQGWSVLSPLQLREPGKTARGAGPIANITYALTRDAWGAYAALLQELTIKYRCRSVCDVGGGANPELSLDFIRVHQLVYTLIDISQPELDKAPADYRKMVLDIAAPQVDIPYHFDLIFTRMLAEHVVDGRQMHHNICRLLNPGGLSVHFFPTLYALPFVVNKLVSDRLATGLLELISPRGHHRLSKFPARYDWCFGLTKAMLTMLEESGFQILEFRALYGHEGYYRRLPLVRRIDALFSAHLMRHPNPYLTSYAQLVLKKVE